MARGARRLPGAVCDPAAGAQRLGVAGLVARAAQQRQRLLDQTQPGCVLVLGMGQPRGSQQRLAARSRGRGACPQRRVEQAPRLGKVAADVPELAQGCGHLLGGCGVVVEQPTHGRAQVVMLHFQPVQPQLMLRAVPLGAGLGGQVKKIGGVLASRRVCLAGCVQGFEAKSRSVSSR
jgi:hypothetical protein